MLACESVLFPDKLLSYASVAMPQFTNGHQVRNPNIQWEYDPSILFCSFTIKSLQGCYDVTWRIRVNAFNGSVPENNILKFYSPKRASVQSRLQWICVPWVVSSSFGKKNPKTAVTINTLRGIDGPRKWRFSIFETQRHSTFAIWMSDRSSRHSRYSTE